MWSYPKKQTPDPDAKGGPSSDDLADQEKARVAAQNKEAAATAKKDAERKEEEAKKELKKSVADSKAKAKADAAAEKAAGEAAVKAADAKKPSLA